MNKIIRKNDWQSLSTFVSIRFFLEKSAITCKQSESVVGKERLNKERVSLILQQISLKYKTITYSMPRDICFIQCNELNDSGQDKYFFLQPKHIQKLVWMIKNTRKKIKTVSNLIIFGRYKVMQKSQYFDYIYNEITKP